MFGDKYRSFLYAKKFNGKNEEKKRKIKKREETKQKKINGKKQNKTIILDVVFIF